MAGEITNEQLAGKVVEAVSAVQTAHETVVEEGKRLTTHMADPNAHGQDVGACIAQSISDHEGNAGAHSALKTALEGQIAAKATMAEVTSAISGKADKTVVDAKADKTAVEEAVTRLNGALAEKVNTTDMTAALAAKANNARVDALDNSIGTLADAAVELETRVDAIEAGGGGSGGSGSTVISQITIAGGDFAPIGHAISYALSASPGLQNGAIISFRYTFGADAERTVVATNNAATIDVTVPTGTAVNTKFTLTVVAVDNYGNERSATKEIAAIAASVKAPTITSPAAGTIVSAISIPMTGTAFSAIGATDTQKRRRGRICKPDGTVLFTGPWVTGSVTSLTLTPTPALSPKASVVLQMQDEGNTLGESPWSAAVTLTVASVIAPTITSPAANAEVNDKNITVVTAAMSLTGGITDTFVGADYTLYDVSGGVIASAKGIAATSHVFAAPVVTKGKYYDLGVVHKSKGHGASIESVKRRIKIKTSMHGEILYDTAGNPAAVVTGSTKDDPWNVGGRNVWVAVALASRRGVSRTWDQAMADGRALNLRDYGQMKLPDKDFLVRIFNMRSTVDALDPTAAANATKKLSNWGFGSAPGAGVWSSSEDGSSAAYYVYSDGIVCNNLKTRQFGVVPALEIPA